MEVLGEIEDGIHGDGEHGEVGHGGAGDCAC